MLSSAPIALSEEDVGEEEDEEEEKRREDEEVGLHVSTTQGVSQRPEAHLMLEGTEPRGLWLGWCVLRGDGKRTKGIGRQRYQR